MASNIKYAIILDWSQSDQAFIAEVPEPPGCAADGATYQEAVANVEVVIQEWIETAQQLGRPIPSPRGEAAVRLTRRPGYIYPTGPTHETPPRTRHPVRPRPRLPRPGSRGRETQHRLPPRR